MKTLWPPLALLETELFSPSDALIERWRSGAELPADLQRALAADPEAHARRTALETALAAEPEVAEAVSELPMPPDLRALIRQRVTSRQTPFSRLPTPGQIVRIDEVRGPDGPLHWDLPRPLAVLLTEPTATRQVWYGWLATAESDYASDMDLLLGEEDQPCDPLARMVQLWNPVHVYLPSVSRVLAELNPQRLAAVRALAVACATVSEPDPALAQPGRIVRRQVAGHWIHTGTPLGGPDDPRHAYQQLYHAYAAAVREPARLAHAQAAQPGILDRLRTSLSAALGGMLEPYRPIAQPMGETDGLDIQHYQIPDGLRLTLTEAADGLATLQLTTMSGQSWRLQLLDGDERVETATLDTSQPVVQFILDPTAPRVLCIGDAEQPERYRIPLFTEEA